jgi:ribosome-binding protein aMBF1 (putative translation factor)
MARFSRADDVQRVWGTYARERRYKHYRGLSRKQRIRLRDKLKEAREHAGLDQRKAAALLGQDQSFISKIESGKRQVEFVEVEQFAEIYQKPLLFFATISQNVTTRRGTKPKKIDRKKRRVR